MQAKNPFPLQQCKIREREVPYSIQTDQVQLSPIWLESLSIFKDKKLSVLNYVNIPKILGGKYSFAVFTFIYVMSFYFNTIKYMKCEITSFKYMCQRFFVFLLGTISCTWTRQYVKHYCIATFSLIITSVSGTIKGHKLQWM